MIHQNSKWPATFLILTWLQDKWLSRAILVIHHYIIQSNGLDVILKCHALVVTVMKEAGMPQFVCTVLYRHSTWRCPISRSSYMASPVLRLNLTCSELCASRFRLNNSTWKAQGFFSTVRGHCCGLVTKRPQATVVAKNNSVHLSDAIRPLYMETGLFVFSPIRGEIDCSSETKNVTFERVVNFV